ncbi:MAG: DUF2065 domain-containing protein [Pseudomonadota bacterium]
MHDLWIALALVVVIEGFLWAAFPHTMKDAARRLLDLPTGWVRGGGVVAMAIGVACVWIVRG